MGPLRPRPFPLALARRALFQGTTRKALLLPAGRLIRPPSHAVPDPPVSATKSNHTTSNFRCDVWTRKVIFPRTVSVSTRS